MLCENASKYIARFGDSVGYLSVCMVLFLMSNVFAQSGKITGTLLDADTKEPLIGATVGIQGTTKGAITDVDGNYLMLNVAQNLCA